MKNNITEKVDLLEKKYAFVGQDINSYLEGLLLSNYLTYWDYLQVDTLLTLQKPKTDFPDELIFITYHQITELYFKLVLHELEQIAHNGRVILPNGMDKGWHEHLNPVFFLERITRVNRYFETLTHSFDVMIRGMDKEQFLRYRMALLPASGFQSAQYRMIEILCTDFIQLVAKDKRADYMNKNTVSIESMFHDIYWNKGATDVATGKKTLTLEQFEKKYTATFITLANDYADKNIWQKYQSLSEQDKNHADLIQALKTLDLNVNVNWPLAHYKSAARYLGSVSGHDGVTATGGTNWQQYLPPHFQKRIFYPTLWAEIEKENWGKCWVDDNISSV